MKYRTSYRSILTALSITLWAGVTLWGCAPEFSDEACQTNSDCFSDEMCSAQGVCVPAGESDTGVDAGDVGEDAGPAEIARVTVEPATAEIGLGGTLQLNATAFDEDDNEIADAVLEWESSDSDVASVDQEGRVSAVTLGEATITAYALTNIDAEAAAEITIVEGEVDTVEVSPTTETILVGEKAQYSAIALNDAGEQISDPTINWSIEDDTIASIDTLGEVTALKAGTTSVIANIEGVEGSAELVVELVPVDRVEIDPTAATIAVGATADLTAKAFDVDDNELGLDERVVTWTTSDAGIAEVDSDGVVTGVSVGTATITVDIGGVTSSIDVEVVAANTAPTATDQTVTTNEDTAIDIQLVGQDADTGDTLEYAIATTPTDGTLGTLDTANGQVTYTPGSGFIGQDSFTFTVTDGTDTSAAATVTINVNGVPTATAPADTDVDVDTDVTLTGTGSDTEDAAGDLDYSWSVTSNGPSGTVTLTNENTAAVTFSADTAGEYVLTVTVTDSQGATATDTVTVTVTEPNTAPTVTAPATETVEANTDVVITATGDDVDEANTNLSYAWQVTTNGPSGTVTLTNENTAAVTFSADTAGEYVLTVTVTDSQGATATDTVTVTVTEPNTAPTVTAPATETVEENTDVVITATGDDVDEANTNLSYAWQVTSNGPSGTVTLTNENTAAVTFAADTAGEYVLTVTVTDSQGATATDTVTVTVTAPNTAPTVTAPATETVEANTNVVITATGDDVDEANTNLSYAWQVTSNGPSGTVTLTNENTAAVTFSADTAGEYVLTVTVTDSQGATATAQVTVTVTAPNTAPVAANDSASTNEDQMATIVVLGNDTDADGDSLDVTITSGPSNGTATVTTDDKIEYTPAAEYSGPDEITYQIDDSRGGTDTAIVSITVNAVDDAPVAVDDAASTNEDVDVTIDVLANDTDIDTAAASLTITAVTQPTNGTTSIVSGGVLYSPDANYNGGPDTFEYTVSDGNSSDTGQVEVMVTAVNDAPVAVNDTAATTNDTTLNVAAPGVLGNDTDVENDALSATLVDGVTNGTLTLNADGSYTYTPNASFVGDDTFTYTASDGTDTSNVATVTISVTAP